ncbi:MAG: hypothetical protein CMJ80_04140 [Planctomycetaceae bacterium]|nr:hypothetical protein [Planctomycetaceae bacterium]
MLYSADFRRQLPIIGNDVSHHTGRGFPRDCLHLCSLSIGTVAIILFEIVRMIPDTYDFGKI